METEKRKKSVFKNPLVWIGLAIVVLLLLKFVVPKEYLTALPQMLTPAGRCALAREQLNNPQDVAAVCDF